MAFRSLRSLHRPLSGGGSALLLALLLALGQQHALLHWLSHAVSSVSVPASVSTPAEAHRLGASDAHDLACDECLALVAFDASSPASAWTFDCAEARDEPVTAPAQPGVATALRLAFRSRAPPILS